MKVYLILIGLLISFPQLEVFSQEILYEGFENGDKPEGWIQEYEVGAVNWRYRNGGYNPSDPNLDNPITPNGEEDIARNPPGAYEGNYNAFFFNQGVNNERTKLITPELNMLGATAVELSFYLCQIPWTFEGSTGWDIMRVYYKVSDADPWVLLQEYLDPVYEWEKQILTLPNPSETYYVAFEGHARWGFGTCLDSIYIEETGIQELYVDEILFEQPFSLPVPSGSSNVPVLRSDIKVFGNTGNLTLEKIDFTSLNSSDDDLSSSGIKLYSTTTQEFNTDNPIGNPTSFSGGIATFSALSHNLSPGHNYIWLTYEVILEATHKNMLDAMVGANDMTIGGGTYPASDQSPAGTRILYHTHYLDDFEGAPEWTLKGEFEIGTPTGNGGDPGNPDPEGASSGINALGTDLTGLGANAYNYESDLIEGNEYRATSIDLDVLYYKDLNLFFDRYLNIEVWDNASIEISADNGVTWDPIWESNGFINDNNWNQEKVSIPEQYWKSEQIKLSFKLGPTNWKDNYSGWNIDNVFITGEFISNDVGVSDWIYPQSGTGHTSSDSITVRIKNYGGEVITDPVPVAYSFNGGSTWTIDYMDTDVPVDGSVVFTFPTRTDLSQPGLRPSVIARTLLPGDQYTGNDQYTTEIYIVPTYVPPYQEDYEDNDGYWRSQGSIWEFGNPAGTVINSASSGNRSWITGLSSSYGDIISEQSQIIFNDGFETDLGWSFNDEFERAIPDGINLPWYANNGFWCIGTDLSGKGDSLNQYENGITVASAYTAISPPLDVSEYSNLVLSFARWLTIQQGDSARVEISDDNGSTWHTLWQNDGAGILDTWYLEHFYSIPDEYTFTAEFRIRFSLYSSSSSGEVEQGWSIDDILLTGDLVNTAQAHLSSPRFDFTGIHNPMISANLWIETEESVDGLNLEYSLDDGITWTPVTNTSGYDSYWNWYTSQPVSALSNSGWTGHTGEWIPVRHLLPASLAGQNNVQFRFTFAADKSDNQYDGIAVDDLQVMEAPHDADLLSVVSPVDACELSSAQQFTLSIRNSGQSVIETGDSLRIGYFIEHTDGTQTADEVYYLTQSVPVGNTLNITTESEFDFSNSGEYLATVYLQSDDPHLYSPVSADTATRVIQVNKPFVDLGNIISTSQPDTVILRAYSGVPGQTYLWQDSSTDSLFHVSGNGIFWVRVTNSQACTASDTIRVVQLFPDVGIIEYLGPNSGCEVEPGLPLDVTVQNLGNDTLDIGSKIILGAIINGNGPVLDTVTLTQQFRPAEQFNHRFSGNFDFSSPGSYQIKLYTQMDLDENPVNDSLIYDLGVYGYPDASIGNDTTVNAKEYLLAPEAGHPDYLWQDGSTDESFTVDQYGAGVHYVTITNDKMCSSSDTVEVTLNVTDLELDQLLSPASACEFSTSIYISALVNNSGNQTLAAGQSITMGYRINSGSVVTEQATLAGDLEPGENFNFSFSNPETFLSEQWYLFTVFVNYGTDVHHENDTINSLVSVYQSSPLDLGEDRVETGQQYTLEAGPDFTSYLWQDSSSNQSFTITSPGIGNYHVTVTDLNGCTLSDSVKIMLAVPDIGVSEVVYPQTNCQLGRQEHVRVAVRNMGNWPLAPSSQVYVSYSVDGLPEVTEPLSLEDTLNSGEVVYHSFSKNEDFSEPKAYNVLAYTTFEDDLLPSNDQKNVNIEHYGPFLEIRTDTLVILGSDTLLEYEPLTLFVLQPYSSYEMQWNDGSKNTQYVIDEPSAGWYWVMAEGENECTGSDSVYVIYDRPDLGIVRFVSPVTSCELGPDYPISIEIINNGFQAISPQEVIQVTYSVDGTSSVFDVLGLESELLPGESTVMTFSDTYDFSDAKDYRIQASLIYPSDEYQSNNLLIEDISVYGSPQFELADGESILVTTLPVTLDVGPGFSSYLWQDGSTNNSYVVTQNGLYWVEVTNESGCSERDSVYVDNGTAVEDLAEISDRIKIYPNPADEFLIIEFNLKVEHEVILELYTVSNSLVYREDIAPMQTSKAEINVQNLAPGTYHLRITSNDKRYNFQVIVE